MLKIINDHSWSGTHRFCIFCARGTRLHAAIAFPKVDFIVTSFYDAVVLYATTIAEVSRRGGNLTDGPAVADLMRNASIPSPLGYAINIDMDGDRSHAYSVKQLSLITGKFEVFIIQRIFWSRSKIAMQPCMIDKFLDLWHILCE